VDSSLDDIINAHVAWRIIEATFSDGKYTSLLDGEKYDGYSFITNFEGRFRHLNFDATYWEFSPTLRVDNGFVNRNNKREIMLDAEYVHYHEGRLIDRITPGMYYKKTWDYDGHVKEEAACPSLTFDLARAQCQIGASYWIGSATFHGVYFDNIRSLDVVTQFILGTRYNIRASYTSARDYSRDLLMPDKETTVKFIGHFRPLDQLVLEPRLTYMRAINADNDIELFEGYIVRLRANYQPTLRLSLRLVAQYDDFYESLEIDPLITYQFNPLTRFYIGSTHDYMDAPVETGNGSELRLEARQFFAKLQYLIQM
jgi:hypothetical protein